MGERGSGMSASKINREQKPQLPPGWHYEDVTYKAHCLTCNNPAVVCARRDGDTWSKVTEWWCHDPNCRDESMRAICDATWSVD